MDKRNISRNIFFLLISGLLLFSCAAPGKKGLDAPKASISLKDSGKNIYCPEGYYLTGLFYSDTRGGSDNSVTKLRCTKFNIPGFQFSEANKITHKELRMNGNGTNWYYLPEGNLIVGAYYSNSDYSIEKFIYAKPVIYLNNKKCNARFRTDKNIQMKGNGTNWYQCPERSFISGAYYKDDDAMGSDDSVERIRCSFLEIRCR